MKQQDQKPLSEMTLDYLRTRVQELLDEQKPVCQCCGKPIKLPSHFLGDDDGREYLTHLYLSLTDK